jgi:transcriptional regulator of met regulon
MRPPSLPILGNPAIRQQNQPCRRQVRVDRPLRNETVSEVICRALEHYVAEAVGGPSRIDPALQALEEARRVQDQEMMREESGVRPEGWSAGVIRAVRDKL